MSGSIGVISSLLTTLNEEGPEIAFQKQARWLVVLTEMAVAANDKQREMVTPLLKAVQAFNKPEPPLTGPIEEIPSCEVVWYKSAGTLYVHNNATGATIVRIQGLPPAQEGASLSRGQMDVRVSGPVGMNL